ncbi:MAG TPA: DUF3108 domain-containing protein [Verrucomicrobiae bacterium]|nr:DUF3108 domain-containing protein [Verrucomicrobiae bacterium]
MRALVLAAALVAVLGIAGGVAAAEPKLPELNLTYAAQWNDIKLGDILVALKAGEGADCYRYESATEPVGMVRMFYGKPREVSEFCVAGGKVVPKRFSYVRGDDSFTLEFDAAKNKVRDGKGAERDVPANAQDRFGLQQAMRLWVIASQGKSDAGPVEFTLVDDERVRTYKFAITGRETLTLPAGTFDTVKVERIDNPKRISRYWVAPEASWMPVKVESGRNGKIQLRMELRKR